MVNYIDYVPGTHGNFMAVIANHYFTDHSTELHPGSTIGQDGRYHRRPAGDLSYLGWQCIHAIEHPKDLFHGCKVLQIVTDRPMLFYGLDRYTRKAGRWNIDIDNMHVDTWNKLNNPQHLSWQQSLAQWQKFDPQHKDMPRSYLREFFYLKFREGIETGLFSRLGQFDTQTQVYHFPLSSLLDKTKFTQEVQNCANWLDIKHVDWPSLTMDHDKFLALNPQHREWRCNNIIDAVIDGRLESCQDIDVLQQAWVWYRLEQIFQKTLTEIVDIWYTDTLQLRRVFESRS